MTISVTQFTTSTAINELPYVLILFEMISKQPTEYGQSVGESVDGDGGVVGLFTPQQSKSVNLSVFQRTAKHSLISL